ncbi:hypothetical protein ACFLZL_00635 [Thermodesulfobacteriota bacterium]
MDLHEAIEMRRTVRKFKGAVSDELLNKIITAGTKGGKYNESVIRFNTG